MLSRILLGGEDDMPTQDKAIGILNWLRLSDLARTLRRVLGFSYLTDSDFLPDIDPEEARRLIALARRARGEGPAPILVLGVMPRSGTNYVRDLLALHPDVLADPGRLYEFPLLHVARGASAFMSEFISSFPRNSEVLGRWDALALLAGAWLREHQSEAGSAHILLKSPHVQNLALAPLVFPDARIILCLRDGRDVVDSSLATFKGNWLLRKTFRQLAEEWRLSTDAILTLAGGDDTNVLVVRYEDLISDQTGSLARIFEFTGLDPSAYDIAKADALPVRGSSRSAMPDQQRWHAEEKTAAFQPVERWRSWPAARVARFDTIAGATLRAAGYERHG